MDHLLYQKPAADTGIDRQDDQYYDSHAIRETAADDLSSVHLVAAR